MARDYKVRRAWLAQRDGWGCAFCPKILNENNATVDHLVPKSHGGKDSYSNLVLACSKCNRKKGSMKLLTFLSQGVVNWDVWSVDDGPEMRAYVKNVVGGDIGTAKTNELYRLMMYSIPKYTYWRSK